MIKTTVLANASATVAGAGYIVCRLISAVAPNFLFTVGQSWFHTVNLESVKTTSSMPMGTFILGLLSSIVVTWVAAYAIAELYNRWAKE